MPRVNGCVLVFKRPAESPHDDLDFGRGVAELRALAHSLGFIDESLGWALKNLVRGNYEDILEANDIDNMEG